MCALETTSVRPKATQLREVVDLVLRISPRNSLNLIIDLFFFKSLVTLAQGWRAVNRSSYLSDVNPDLYSRFLDQITQCEISGSHGGEYAF
jgi:hypothetical protein